MMGPDAQAAEDRLREAIRDARRYLTDEAVIWRAVAMSHDHAEDGHWPTREARARADAAVRALEPPDTAGAEAASGFELEAGDIIRNTRTGRRGLTYIDTSGNLWVGDIDPRPDAARAEAVEEYEHWYPGTYEKIKEAE